MPTIPLSGDLPVFALVAYIPAPLGLFLDQLRNSFPAQKGGYAHLTFLAPRPLSISAEAARTLVTPKLERFDAFEVELTEVLRFPSTNVIYLGLGHGREDACRLHESLNEGPLAYAEPFEYRPHVSLVFPPDGADIDGIERAVAAAWNACRLPRRFRVEKLDFLQNAQNGDWNRLWNYPLRDS